MSDHLECFHCGAQNRDTAHFCRHCGQPIASRPASAPQSADQLTAEKTAGGGASAVTETRQDFPIAQRADPPPAPETLLPAPETAWPVVPPMPRTSADPAGPPPPVDPAGSGPSFPPRARSHPWWPAPLILAVVLGAAGLAGWQTRWPTAVFGARPAAHEVSAPHSSGASSPPAASSGGSATGGSSAGTGGSAQQQAADSLAGLLSQSVSDRSSVNDAFNDVLQCGPDLSQDAQTFQGAAQARQQLISQLAALPSQSALSPSMLQDLSGAWQESQQVDSDYAQWAQDEAGNGCTGTTTDPSYVAAENPNRQATADKTAFAGEWNPVAAQYDLTQYQQGEL